MIATITLNPAIDIRYQVPNFHSNEVNRASTVDRTAGGKGLNVTRVLQSLGSEVLCTGFLGGKNGEWIREKLEELPVEQAFVPINGETRLCFAIMEDHSTEQTELLEPGPVISNVEEQTFLEKFDEILERAEYIVASGSLPKGLPKDFYKVLVEKAKEKGKYFILDSSGDALLLGLQANPFLIKPNKSELCQLLQKPSDSSLTDLLPSIKNLCEQGVQHVLLSLGEEGALLVTKEKNLLATIPSIQAVNPVGSGDSMVAGFAFSALKNFSLEDSLKWACACGMANAVEERTGAIQPKQVEQFFKVVEITEL